MTNEQAFQLAITQEGGAPEAAGVRVQQQLAPLYKAYRLDPHGTAAVSYQEHVVIKQRGYASATEEIARRIKNETAVSGATEGHAQNKIMHDDPDLWEEYVQEHMRAMERRVAPQGR